MTVRRWHTRVKVSGVVIAAGAELGIEESHEDLQSHAPWLTWNGVTKVGGPDHFDKKLITLTCGDRWGPSWEALRVRDVVDLHSSVWLGAHIPAGLTSVVLRRSPVPVADRRNGYDVVAYRVDTNERLACTVVGKTVGIAAPLGVDVMVQYRPIRPCVVVGKGPQSQREIEGRGSWSMKLADLA